MLKPHLDNSSDPMAQAFELSDRGRNFDPSEDLSFDEALKTTEYDRTTLNRLGKNPILKVSLAFNLACMYTKLTGHCKAELWFPVNPWVQQYSSHLLGIYLDVSPERNHNYAKSNVAKTVRCRPHKVSLRRPAIAALVLTAIVEDRRVLSMALSSSGSEVWLSLPR